MNSSNGESDYEPRYLQGIALFNECEFFEAHDIWEELWADTQGPRRRFYQGLIQAAVCLHHFGNGNTGGARKLYHGCRSYLEEYAPMYLGLDLGQFLEQMRVCCSPILESDEPRPRVDIVVDDIPEIHLVPNPSAPQD